MRQVPFEVLMHAEDALAYSNQALSVLSMWIDSIPDGDEHREELCVRHYVSCINLSASW
jgi:hypothetical protein